MANISVIFSSVYVIISPLKYILLHIVIELYKLQRGIIDLNSYFSYMCFVILNYCRWGVQEAKRLFTRLSLESIRL